jgi:hypothetical protein
MVMQFKIFKKILFGIALCAMPMVLFGMNSARRVGSAKRTAKVMPVAIEQGPSRAMPRQIEPAKAFQVVAAASIFDRPESPHFPMSPEFTKRIEKWVEKGPGVTSSVPFDENSVVAPGRLRYSSASEPISGVVTPLHFPHSISDGSLPSSSSQYQRFNSIEERLWTLERITEDNVLKETDSEVSCHEIMNKLLNVGFDEKIEIVSRAIIAHDCRQQCAQERLVTLQQRLDDSSGALKSQKEVTETLAKDLKEKDKKVETLESGISALALQLTRLQAVVQRQQRPWWKRCGCCASQIQDCESENSESEHSEKELCSLRAPTLNQVPKAV